MRIDNQTEITGAAANASFLKRGERRSYALDGLRGLAALSVVFLHIVSYTPFAAVWDGEAAVLIFFVLSGFALHRMLDAGKMSYANYAVRRILRLWLPYAAAIFIAVLSVYFIGSHDVPGQTHWLNLKLGTQLSVHLIAQHALMVGVFDFNSLDFVIWSLVQEMRISLLFPIIYFALKKYPSPFVLFVSLIIQLIALVMIAHGHSKYTNVSFVVTFKYQIYFVIGAIISAHEEDIRKYIERMPKIAKISGCIAVLFLYPNCLKIPTLFPTLIGATGIVIIVISSPLMKRMLNIRSIQFLGKISYSLYLIHAVVLLGLINLLYPEFSFPAIAAISVPIICVFSYLLNRFVEMPSIKLSRMAGKAF